MRVERSLKNGMVSVFAQLLVTASTFIIRTVIIYSLSIEYAGLQTLFASVMAILNLAEMGVYTSMVNYLYKPLALGEQERVKNIISLLGRIYKFVILLITLAGIVLFFFVDKLIYEQPFPLDYLRIVYLLNLLATILNYVGTEKRVLLFAMEKKFVYMKIDIISNLLFFIFQVFVLVLFKNYLIYLLLVALKNLATNIWIQRHCNRIHPELNGPYRRDKALEKTLIKDTKNAMFQRVSETVFNSTDNIVISAFQGIAISGIYANYNMIFQTIRVLYIQFFDSVQSSFGHLIAENEADHPTTHALYQSYTFISYFIGSVCFCCFISLTQPFVSLWVTPELKLSNAVMVLMAVNFLMNVMSLPISQIYFVLRLYNKDRWSMLSAAILNVVLSAVFIHIWSLEGVIFATLISQLIMIIARYYYVFRYGFKSLSCIKDMGLFFLRILFALLLAVLSYGICRLMFDGYSFLSIFGRLGICLLIGIMFNCLFFFRTKEFQLLWYKARDLWRKLMMLIQNRKNQE